MQHQYFSKYQQYCCCAECSCSLPPFPSVDFGSKSSSQTPVRHAGKLTSAAMPPVVRNKARLNTKLNSLGVSRHDALDVRRCVHYSTDKCVPESHPAWIQKWSSSYQQNNGWLSSHCTELETCYLQKEIALIFKTRGKTGTWKIQVKCICNGNTRQSLETQEGTEGTLHTSVLLAWDHSSSRKAELNRCWVLDLN